MRKSFLSLFVLSLSTCYADEQRPNIVFLFSDDHAVKTISAYGGKMNQTPHIDRIAKEGAIFRSNFCGNSICGPSRATILTGKHSHQTGFATNRSKPFDGAQMTFPKELQKAGYRTAIFGKWHLKSAPTGFDEWMVYPGQGSYYNPDYRTPEGNKRLTGYSVEVTTDLALNFLKERKKSEQPFLLMCQYKAPHRNWMPGPKYLNMYDEVTLPEPDTLFDDYANRSVTLGKHKMGIANHMSYFYDLKVEGGGGSNANTMKRFLGRMNTEQRETWDKAYGPKNKVFMENKSNMTEKEKTRWKYQRYMKDYLRCVTAVDDNVGRILKYLDDNGLSENTIVVYSSDQGFYLGEHGWYDKRWMFEESFSMPLVMRWPGKIKPGSQISELTQNIDYAPTFLEAAGLTAPEEIQGCSMLPLFKGESKDWRQSVYYQYAEGGGHGVPIHYGVRDHRYKLMYFPKTEEWNLFDLETDPKEMKSEHANPEYADRLETLKKELERLRAHYDVKP